MSYKFNPFTGTLDDAGSSGGAGANTTLSNLTSPTAVNQDLILDGGHAIQTKNQAAATEYVEIQTGNSSGAASGDMSIHTGSAASNFNTGSLNIQSWPAAGAAISGNVGVSTGGSYSTGGNSGTLTFGSGGADFNTGNVTIQSGNSVNAGITGSLGVVTGEGIGIGGASGQMLISTGSANLASGLLNILTGASSTGNSGEISVSTGDAAVGNSGNVQIQTGTAVGQKGNIILNSAKYVLDNYTSGFWGDNAPAFSAVQGTTNTIQMGGRDHDTDSTNTGLDVFISTGQKAGTSSSGSTGRIYLKTGGFQGTAQSGSIQLLTGGADEIGANGLGTSGSIDMYTGSGGIGSPSGNVNIGTGFVYGSPNTSGSVFITTSPGYNSGEISLSTGSSGANASGNLTLNTGSGLTASGALLFNTGNVNNNGATSGTVTLKTGNGTANNTDSGAVLVSSGTVITLGLSGSTTVTTGNASSNGSSGSTTISTGTSAAANSGDVSVISGAAVGDTGNVLIKSGAGTNTGSVTVETGAAGGTRGKIKLVDGSQGTIGHVWASTDVNGSGSWAAVSGGANTALSNITNTALSEELIFGSGVTGKLRTRDVAGTSTTLTLKTGDSSGAATGSLILQVGTPASNSNAGTMTIIGADGSGTGSGSSTLIISGAAGASGTAGNLTLQTQSAGGVFGKIRLQNGTQGTSGHVWTSTDTVGSGSWAAVESINARAYNSSTTISGTLATIVWTTEDYDTNSALASGVFTVPSSGKYHVDVSLAISGTFILNNTSILDIQVNGTSKANATRYIAAAITNESIQLSSDLQLTTGDTVRVQYSTSGTAPSIVSSDTKNFFNISKLGN